MYTYIYLTHVYIYLVSYEYRGLVLVSILNSDNSPGVNVLDELEYAIALTALLTDMMVYEMVTPGCVLPGITGYSIELVNGIDKSVL